MIDQKERHIPNIRISFIRLIWIFEDTSSMDGAGIDVWVGSGEKQVDAIMCTVDLIKKDSEIKILIGCTEEEKAIICKAHN